MRAESKNEEGYGMTRLLMAGCGIKIFRWERDLLILADGMRDEKQKITRFAENWTLTRRDEDKYSDWRGMGGLSQK